MLALPPVTERLAIRLTCALLFATGLAWGQGPALERATLRGGVTALRAYAPGPEGTPDALSLLLFDAELLALVDPAARDAVDAAAAKWRGRRALAVVATATEAAALPLEALSLRQDGREVRPDAASFEVLSCDPERLPPDRACLALWWLPASVRPDRPVRVSWFDERVEVRFRH